MVRVKCAICKNYSTVRNDLSFHRIPAVHRQRDPDSQELQRLQRSAWIDILLKGNVPVDNLAHYRICGEHFQKGKPADFRKFGDVDWVPHLNLYDWARRSYNQSKTDHSYGKPPGLMISEAVDDTNASHSTQSAIPIEDANSSHNNTQSYSPLDFLCLDYRDVDLMKPEAAVSMDMNTASDIRVPRYPSICDEETQTDPSVLPNQSTRYAETDRMSSNVQTQTDISKDLITSMESELRRKNKEIRELRQQVAKNSLKEAAFRNDDAKVKFFTGLPTLNLVNLILSTIDDSLSHLEIKGLDNFEKLVLTLMKLRLNTSFRGLAYRFRIKKSQASGCFRNVVIILERTFHDLLFWPERQNLFVAVPRCFRGAFGSSVGVIIDCFEIRTQRPTNTEAREQLFSSAKKHYSAKYLIGMNAQGNVCYASDGWGGCATDDHIIEDCNLMDRLLPGDVMMSDRGFTIKDSVSVNYDELPMSNVVEKLAPETVQRIRNIASARIPVERMIGGVRKKFSILNGPVPINFFKCKFEDKCLLDYVVRTTCILWNLCDSIVPFD